MAEDELVRRGLQLEWEIASHELECLVEDGADSEKIDAKISECERIMARRRAMDRRDALRRQYAMEET